MIICSHRRSGTHLLLETLNLNFKIKLTENDNKTHKIASKIDPSEQVVYVVRDGRDVLLSCYDWWDKSNESVQSNIAPYFTNLTKFADYLNKKIQPTQFVPCMVKQWEMDEGLITDPISFWIRHVQGFLDRKGTIIINYDQLKDREIISQLGGLLNLKKQDSKIKIINTPVGYYLGNKQYLINNTNKWKKGFNKGTLSVFNNVVKNFNDNICKIKLKVVT